eukprot:UN04409
MELHFFRGCNKSVSSNAKVMSSRNRLRDCSINFDPLFFCVGGWGDMELSSLLTLITSGTYSSKSSILNGARLLALFFLTICLLSHILWWHGAPTFGDSAPLQDMVVLCAQIYTCGYNSNLSGDNTL